MVHLAQNVLGLYNRRFRQNTARPMYTYAPAPNALSIKLKTKDLFYLTNPRICGLSLEQNQVLGPARAMVYVRSCDDGQVYHTVSLNVSATASAADVTIGISGHGFFMASESLTTHPSGPGMQPFNTTIPFSSSTFITLTFCVVT